MTNPRLTAAEMRDLTNQCDPSFDLVDKLLDEARKLALRGVAEMPLTAVVEYLRVPDERKEDVHAALRALGFKLEMNRNAALHHMVMKW